MPYFRKKVWFSWLKLFVLILSFDQTGIYKPCYKQSRASMHLPFARSWQDLVVCLSFPNSLSGNERQIWKYELLSCHSFPHPYCIVFLVLTSVKDSSTLPLGNIPPTLKNNSYYYLLPKKQKEVLQNFCLLKGQGKKVTAKNKTWSICCSSSSLSTTAAFAFSSVSLKQVEYTLNGNYLPLNYFSWGLSTQNPKLYWNICYNTMKRIMLILLITLFHQNQHSVSLYKPTEMVSVKKLVFQFLIRRCGFAGWCGQSSLNRIKMLPAQKKGEVWALPWLAHKEQLKGSQALPWEDMDEPVYFLTGNIMSVVFLLFSALWMIQALKSQQSREDLKGR